MPRSSPETSRAVGHDGDRGEGADAEERGGAGVPSRDAAPGATGPSEGPPWPLPERSAVAVGLFDGVHRGHEFLLRELVRWGGELDALPVVVTFDPHPAALIAGQGPQLIASPCCRVRLIEALGIERVWLVRPDEQFVRMRAASFVRSFLRDRLNAVGLLVGFDNRLGSDRCDASALARHGEEVGLKVRQCEPFLIDGVPVSSTIVRRAIVEGRLDLAERLLGRRVSVTGQVVAGAGLGRGLGYPTANVRPDHGVMIPCGIYAAEVRIDNRRLLAAVSVGACPTLSAEGIPAASGPFREGEHTVEAHILDYDGDLLGRWVEISILRKLREEARFPDVAALVGQIERDVAMVREIGAA